MFSRILIKTPKKTKKIKQYERLNTKIGFKIAY